MEPNMPKGATIFITVYRKKKRENGFTPSIYVSLGQRCGFLLPILWLPSDKGDSNLLTLILTTTITCR